MKKKNNETDRTRRVSPGGVSDLLSLVSYDIPMRTVKTWSPEVQQEVANWAFAVHLRASDNSNRIPKKPEILKQFKEVSWDANLCL